MIFPYATSPGDTVTNAVADVAKSLRYPVLILSLLALFYVLYELGRLGVEMWRRSQKETSNFDQTARHALGQARSGDSAGAQATLRAYSYGDALAHSTIATLFASNPIDAQRAVIEYDLYVSKRLDRVRLLVRAGPALGLMGTLIPLAPALSALGKGQPSVLADELQTAFSVTIVGVAVGLIAFSVALVRERYYTKDLADLEFLREVRGDAAILVPATLPQPSAAAPSHMTSTDQPTVVGDGIGPDSAVVATPAQSGSAPVLAPPPAPAEKPKKKFGLKKKSDAPAAPAAFPPPPPAPIPGQAPAAPATPATPPQAPITEVTSDPISVPSDKSPSIPDPPAKPAAPQPPKPDAPADSPTDDKA